MNDLLSDTGSWVWWALGLIVVVPALVVFLAEVHQRLVRRGSSLAKPVNTVRLWLLPAVGLLVLLIGAAGADDEVIGVRLVATVVGVLAVTVSLAALNAVLFADARAGTWRERMPSIFVDLARLILIVAGAAVVASTVWGADVGGLFAALGVGSIVIGLALQNAVGGVVSGLLLLFEQPFKIGDFLEAAGARGRVVEVNWRSTHIDTGTGLTIIPNAVIAGASFANLSRPTPAHDEVVEVAADPSTAPHVIREMLTRVAHDVPRLRDPDLVDVRLESPGQYRVSLPLATARDAGLATSTFWTWLWYAAAREGHAIDGAIATIFSDEETREAAHQIARRLYLDDEALERFVSCASLQQFGPGERISRQGEVPKFLRFIVDGQAESVMELDDGAVVPVAMRATGEPVELRAMTREPASTSTVAKDAVVTLTVSLDAADDALVSSPRAARGLQTMYSLRGQQIRRALALAADDAPVPYADHQNLPRTGAEEAS